MARLTIVVVAVLAASTGCERKPKAPPAPESAVAVAVRPATVRLRSGESRQLSAQANDAAGAAIGGATLQYVSKTPALLTVSSTGIVTSVGPAGSGQVEVASGKASATVEVSITAGATDALRVVGGGGQSAVSGAVVGEPVAVRAEDQRGNPVPGVVVRFAADGEGATAPTEATTDDTGVASTRWTLGPRAGTQTLTATVADEDDVMVTVTGTAGAGPAARIERYGEAGDTVAAGESLAARVRVVDAHDNPVAEVPVTWTDDSGGRFEQAADATDEQGAAGAAWYPRPVVGEQRARVVTPALADQGVDLVATVRAAAAARLEVVAGEGQRGAAGKPAPVAAQVRVVDEHGNPVANAAVSFAVAEGTGSVDATPVVTDEAGLATARDWVLAAGSNKLSATLAGTDASVSVTATGRGRR